MQENLRAIDAQARRAYSQRRNPILGSERPIGSMERRSCQVRRQPTPLRHELAPLPLRSSSPWTEPRPTAVLVLADGTVIEGFGVGATGEASGEVCFNTAMTGYEEILTDPSYAGQIVTFTFPHIGNVGVNDEDVETVNMAASSGVRGVVHRPRRSPSPRTGAPPRLRRMAAGARHRRHQRRRYPRLDRTHPREGHAECDRSPIIPKAMFDRAALAQRRRPCPR